MTTARRDLFRMRDRLLAALLLALLVSACGEATPGSEGSSPNSSGATLPATPASRQLLLELDAVQPMEGFQGLERLEAYHDYPGVNADREGVVVPAPRVSRLRWELGTTPSATLDFELARLAVGPAADLAPGELIVRALLGEQELSASRVALTPPALNVDPNAHPSRWREGGTQPVSVAIPADATALELEFRMETEPVGGQAWAMLSPRLLSEPTRVPLAQRGVRVPTRRTPLLGIMEREVLEPEVVSRWRVAVEADRAAREAAGLPNEGESVVAPVSIDGRFSGRKPRHAVALLEGATARWPARVLRGVRLRGAVALDQRMPESTSGVFVLRAGAEVLARIPVASERWQSVDLELEVGAAAVALELSLERSGELAGSRTIREADLVRGSVEEREHAPVKLRAGFADLRLEADGVQAREAASLEAPSVLLIQVETLRADALADPDVAPNLRRLAAAGVSHARAITPSPWTVPSTATLFTGLSPSSHGVVDHHRSVLPASATTLAERLLDAGWITAGIVTNTLLNTHAGWSRGFTSYLELPEANMRQVGALARDWVAAQGDSRWFLFLHPFDPHGPHNAPDAFRQRFVEPELRGRDYLADEATAVNTLLAGQKLEQDAPLMRSFEQRYAGDVAYFDREVGRLLSSLDEQGVLDTTLVVLTSDHGEEFAEFGYWGHGTNLYEPATRVPLVLVPPGALSGWARGEESGEAVVIEAPIAVDGLHATLLGLLGVEIPADEPLRPAFGEQREGLIWLETEKGVALEVPGDPQRRPIRGIRSATHLLVRRSRLCGEAEDDFVDGAYQDELWALGEAVGDAQRLPTEGEVYDGLRAALERELARVRSEALLAPEAGGSAEQVDDLRALGYVGGSGPVGADNEDC